MKQQGTVAGRLLTIGLCMGLGFSSSVVADQGWTAPAPMGPYGGHFDFGIPASSEQPVEAAVPQAAHAVYQQQNELPVINASYAQADTTPAAVEQSRFSQEELVMIDPAWSLESELDSTPQGVNGGGYQGDIWALGEIQPEKLPALVEQPAEVVAVRKEAATYEPCSVPQSDSEPLLTTAHTPFQEAVLDEFERGDLDMEAMGREADRLSSVEEQRSRNRRAAAPVYYPTFMPDYALGVRRADAMDPLALIPQMSNPVQYFGFRQ